MLEGVVIRNNLLANLCRLEVFLVPNSESDAHSDRRHESSLPNQGAYSPALL